VFLETKRKKMGVPEKDINQIKQESRSPSIKC
jgi:hypothetical protein